MAQYANARTGSMSENGCIDTGSAPMKSDRFTTGGRMPPSNNPKQPHLGLKLGDHTHPEATRAVNSFHRTQAGPAFSPNGKPGASAKPAASSTPKSMANKDMRTVGTKAAVDRTASVPRGKSSAKKA